MVAGWGISLPALHAPPRPHLSQPPSLPLSTKDWSPTGLHFPCGLVLNGYLCLGSPSEGLRQLLAFPHTN